MEGQRTTDNRQQTLGMLFKVNSQQTTDNSPKVFSTVAVSEDGDIYLTDVKNYMQNGDVLRYDSDGNFVTKFEAGIVPGAMMFN